MFDQIIQKIADGKPLVGNERQEFINTMRELNQSRATVQTWGRTLDYKIGADNLDLPFVPIYSQVLEAKTASLTIEIPSEYKHLKLYINGLITDRAASSDSLCFRFNEDSGNNYFYQYLAAVGASVVASSAASANRGFIAILPADNATGAYIGAVEAAIPGYLSETTNKAVLSKFALQYDLTNLGLYSETSTWMNDDPIRSMTLFPNTVGANLAVGMSISIYGLK